MQKCYQKADWSVSQALEALRACKPHRDDYRLGAPGDYPAALLEWEDQVQSLRGARQYLRDLLDACAAQEARLAPVSGRVCPYWDRD